MTNPILSAQNLKQYYQVSQGMGKMSQIKAVDDVSFDLYSGKTLALVGESGSGKSTLARMLTLIEKPTEGLLKINNQDTSKLTATERSSLRQTIQLVFQDPYGSLNPRWKIGHIIGEGLLLNTKLTKKQIREEVEFIMQKVGLRPEFFDRYPHQFSGGQRQRIAIARALALKPSIMILDEPVSALDISIQAQVLNLFSDLQQEFNLSYLFISHDLSVVEHFSDEVMVMHLGKVVEYAKTSTLFAKPKHDYTKALLSASPIPDPRVRIERKIYHSTRQQIG